MAVHLHTQIRNAAKTALTGLPSTGAHVYTNRLHPLGAADLPGLRIYIGEEASEDLTVDAPVAQRRQPVLIVECCAKETGEVFDVLDQISLEVEAALAGGITVAHRLLLSTYDGMQHDEEIADKPAGVKRLRFSIPYTAAANAPDVLI